MQKMSPTPGNPESRTEPLGTQHGAHQAMPWLKKAVPDHLGAKFMEQEVPGDPQHNKLVVKNSDRTAYIIDRHCTV